MIKVSVIMPVYNAEKYLPTALDCLLAQTLKEIEIICVDDGSTDNSAIILEEYAKKDSRIRIIRQNNQYAGVARNNGMAKAKGKYLSFLDADDYFKPDMLKEAYECAQKIGADIVVFGGEYFVGDPKNAYHNPSLLREDLLPDNTDVLEKGRFNNLFHFTTSSPWNKLYRRAFIEECNLKFQSCKRVNDAYFVEMAFALAERIGILRKDLIAYRTGNSESLQGTNAESPLQFAGVIMDIKKALIEHGLYDRYEKSFRNYCLSNCIYNLESLDSGAAFEKLYNALKEELFYSFNIVGSKEVDYYNKYAYKQYKYIMTHTAVEYWRDKYYGNRNLYKEYLFPFGKVEKNSRIILYAAGNVGKKFYHQVKKSGYCVIEAWVDKNVKLVDDICISSPNNTDMNNCDYVVVAIESEVTAARIIKDLIENYSVEPDKIIWENPVV